MTHLSKVKHHQRGWVVKSELCYQGGAVFGHRETMERTNTSGPGPHITKSSLIRRPEPLRQDDKPVCYHASFFDVADSAGDILIVVHLHRGLQADIGSLCC